MYLYFIVVDGVVMMFNKVYSAPTLSILIKYYLINEIDVKYSGSKYLDRDTYKHCFELVYNGATLYNVDLLIVSTKAYISLAVPNVSKEEREIELFSLDEQNQDRLIVNTLISLCNDLNVRIFK